MLAPADSGTPGWSVVQSGQISGNTLQLRCKTAFFGSEVRVWVAMAKVTAEH